MWDKIKKTLFSNMVLKILAIFASILLWILVVNVDDPVKSTTFTAKVQVTNADVLTKNGQYYEVTSEDSTVSFRVSGKRSIIEKLSNSDFTATADMNYLNSDNQIPIDIEPIKYNSLVTMPSKSFYLKVTVGNLQTKKFTVKPVTKGTPAEGIVIGEVKISPSVITVNGPETVVSSIKSVTASCDVSKISKDVTEHVVPQFFDAKGKEVNTSKLTISSSTVDMSVDVASSKKVPIKVESSGQLPDGLKLSGITINPSQIDVQGEADILNNLTAIVIPGSVIDLSKIADNLDTTVDISSYLPDGVELLDSTKNQAEIKVSVEKPTSKEIAIPTANLTVSGMSQSLEAKFTSDTVTINVKGFTEDINAIQADKITGSVDAVGLTKGKHQVTVSINLADGLTVDPASTEVEIRDKSTSVSN
jgi:YbbR domain-containing protein